MALMVEKVVIDTSVLVSALKSGGGASRAVLRLCLQHRVKPLMGEKLLTEIEAVFSRVPLFRNCALTRKEREELLDAFFSVCEWVPIYYLWRPNLRDEGDNHVLELAVAGDAGSIVTLNVRDFREGQLKFPQVLIETPSRFLNRWRTDYGNDDDSTS